MNVELFCKQIAMNKNREDYLNSRLVKNYIPYEEKIARCEQIVNITSYIEIDGHKVYRINTPIRLVLTSLTLINEYTDIDINFEDESFLKDYNTLESQGLIDELLQQIPEHEYKTWITILHMTDDDKKENERSLINYFDTKITALEKILTSTAEVISEEADNNPTK